MLQNEGDENYIVTAQYSTRKRTFKSPDLNTNLRASAMSKGCSLGFWAAGTSIAAPFALVNPLASIAVGFAYQVLSIWAYDKIKE